MARHPASSTQQYVAFLRGINVGGNKLIKMADLKVAFEKAGMKQVKTVLAAGNVVFETRATDPAALNEKLEAALEKSFGHPVGIVLRTVAQLERFHKSAPFKAVTVKPTTRLWVTFLKDKSKGKMEVPTVIELTGNLRAGMEQMAALDKAYGKSITTRSWNTIGKILTAARAQ
jgi:uncharacterized protein (DUF1697 family)